MLAVYNHIQLLTQCVLQGQATTFPTVTCRVATHQQTPESEATLLVCNSVLAVEAALSLSHRLHSHIPLCVPTQRLHRSVAAEDERTRSEL